MAKAAGIPTFEVQSGVISPSRRFVPPRADDVLCIDPFSHEVYSGFLKHDPKRTFIVGSPKMDLELAPVRDMTRDEARALLPELHPHREARIVMLATQPIGAATGARLVEIAIEAMRDDPASILLVKQHPNEDDHYADAYRAVAGRLAYDRMIVSRTAHIHHCIIAADIVMVYYSTVGLEAFGLKRPVICINPLPGRPPFDLVQLGIAREVTAAEELRTMLHHGVAPDDDVDPRLSVLQDGLAATRCAEHIHRTILDRAARTATKGGE